MEKPAGNKKVRHLALVRTSENVTRRRTSEPATPQRAYPSVDEIYLDIYRRAAAKSEST